MQKGVVVLQDMPVSKIGLTSTPAVRNLTSHSFEHPIFGDASPGNSAFVRAVSSEK